MPNNRREFCVQTCRAISLAALAPLLESCGGSPTSPSTNVPSLATVNGAVANGTVTVTIDAASPLGAAGSAALVQSGAGNFLVARTGGDAFIAVTAVCTHEGCTVTGYQNATYTCPCHGSQFSTSGAVLRGPASRALQSYATTFSGTTLSIRL